MKKFLVVLLVLAVAGGVFALDGEWSLSAAAELGTVINLDPDPTTTDDNATIEGTHYYQLYDGHEVPRGTFGMHYSVEGLTAGLNFATDNGEKLLGDVNYNGENFNFGAASDLSALIAGNRNFNYLYGNYAFMNGVVFLEASYARGWLGNAWWASDTTAGIANWNGYGFNPFSGPVGNGDRNTFTITDGNGANANYLVANVRLTGLEFGFKLRDLFWFGTNDNWAYSGNDPVELIDDVLKGMILGVKFNMSPIEVAVQFLMKDYGIYLGGKWFVGPITVGLSFMGLMDAEPPMGVDSWTIMKVGAAVDYAADQFGAGIKGTFGMEGEKTLSRISQIGVEPYFYYNVIPTHLQFKTDVGFYFYSGYVANEEMDLKIKWALQPQLFWNFLGTGAGGYGGTGISVRYRMVSGFGSSSNAWEGIIDDLMGANNKLDVCFTLSF